MSKITKLRIKKEDGTFANPIDFGAKALNVSLQSGQNLEDAMKDIVKVSNTQPIEDSNRVWIQKSNSEVEIPTMGDFNDLKDDLSDTNTQMDNSINPGNVIDPFQVFCTHNSTTSNGVTFTWEPDNSVCNVTGISFANSDGINNLFSATSVFPPAFNSRKPVFLVKSTNKEHLYIQLFYYINGSMTSDRPKLYDGITQLIIPDNITGILIRITADKGSITYNDTISVKMILSEPNYLPSFGISSVDVKSAIEKILATYGECKLGAGVYGVTGIDMPAKTKITGVGELTDIRLMGSNAGFAIKMLSNCSVTNLKISGAISDIDLSSDIVGTRHGILWQGDYSSSHDGSIQPVYGIISDCWIERFTGGGITCDNTGPGTDCGLNVTNVVIRNCGAGINIAYYSEFHRFTNVCAWGCYYGCVNNGGNNIFVNCGFSRSLKMGFVCKMVDGTGRTKTNNTHGSAIGCVFNHIDRDDTTLGKGDAVHFESTNNGFIFDGCQFFYGNIYLSDAKATVFSDCLIGPARDNQGTTVGYPIILINTDAVTRKAFFNGCVFSRQPVFTITNEGSGTIAPIINNCYTHGGSVISS